MRFCSNAQCEVLLSSSFVKVLILPTCGCIAAVVPLLLYSGKIPLSPGTIPISKYRLPIYQSLCLDHFETPRHVRDHIWDSEQPSVHQNIQTHNETDIETLSVRTYGFENYVDMTETRFRSITNSGTWMPILNFFIAGPGCPY